MNRYFDLPSKRLTVKINIKNGTPACSAGIEDYKKYFKCDDVREVDSVEYHKLSNKYRSGDTNGNPS